MAFALINMVVKVYFRDCRRI